ncbi:MAG: hypothetical protein M3297_16245 [Thermoproteota archaeon]|nr:hypothetical protein [Thermoproteota archaeon]
MPQSKSEIKSERANKTWPDLNVSMTISKLKDILFKYIDYSQGSAKNNRK